MALRKRKETPLVKLECGKVYRITGSYHARVLGVLLPGGGTAAGTYEGHVNIGGRRYLFRDSNGTEYILTPPELTGGLVSARVYALKAVG